MSDKFAKPVLAMLCHAVCKIAWACGAQPPCMSQRGPILAVVRWLMAVIVCGMECTDASGCVHAAGTIVAHTDSSSQCWWLDQLAP